MIYKDISFIEKVLSEQEHLKSKCEHKLDSLQVYKGQFLNVQYVKGHPYYSAYFPGEKKVLHFFLGDFNKRTNLHRSATA